MTHSGYGLWFLLICILLLLHIRLNFLFVDESTSRRKSSPARLLLLLLLLWSTTLSHLDLTTVLLTPYRAPRKGSPRCCAPHSKALLELEQWTRIWLHVRCPT